MNIHKLSENLDVQAMLAAVSRAAGNADSAAIDVSAYAHALAFPYSFGDKGAAGTVEIKVQESDDEAFGSGVTDVTGATTGVMAATGSGTLHVRVRQFSKRYARVRQVTATNACVAATFLVAQKLNAGA